MKTNYLTKAERAQFILTTEQKDILVGLILGDLNVRKVKGGVNAKLKFEQGTVHEDYLLHLYDLFKNYCTAPPKTTSRAPDTRTGKVYSAISFDSYSLPCFNELYDLFYPDGKKIIPTMIGALLTPLGLAYLICDDGTWCKQGRRVKLCTESFGLEDVNLLVDVLNNKFHLKCYKNKRGTGHRIIIPSYSIPVLQNLLASHMPSMMKHKINL
jgi:hypothetical protein